MPAVCKVCAGEAWEDAPLPLCRACVITAGMFMNQQRDRYLDQLAQDEVTAAFAPGEGQVYYLRWGDRIKIGTSICPAKRALALSLDPANIVVTERGGHHREFEHLRIEGEWFAAGDELLAHIEALAVA